MSVRTFVRFEKLTPLPRRRMYQALSVPGIASATPVYLGTSLWTNLETGDTTNFRLIGVDPDVSSFVDPTLTAQTRRLREPNAAIIDRRTRGLSPDVEAEIRRQGRYQIEMSGRRVDMVGTFEQGASFDVDGTLIVSDQTFQGLLPVRGPGTPSLILVTVDRPHAAKQIAAQINARILESDVIAMTKVAFVAAEQNYQATQSPIGFVFGFGVVIGMVVGLVIVYQVLATDVQDHMSEYATFKAIGYSRPFFLSVIFEEAVILAALGFLPGFVVSLTFYQLAAGKTGLPISMPISRPVLVFALTMAMCTISGAIATRRLNSADPADLF